MYTDPVEALAHARMARFLAEAEDARMVRVARRAKADAAGRRGDPLRLAARLSQLFRRRPNLRAAPGPAAPGLPAGGTARRATPSVGQRRMGDVRDSAPRAARRT